MKKIVNGNSGCVNCINKKEYCASFINKMVKKGLNSCINGGITTVNYIYEKENEMKLTKAQKASLKNNIEYTKEIDGFIHIYGNGITQVFIPASKAKDNRMFKFGISVCNETDKYNREYGIYLAMQDLYTGQDKFLPAEIIGCLDSTEVII